jgi:hypothetical protein
MPSPIEHIANSHLILAYTDLQVQLERGTGTRPVLWLLAEARKKAANAIALLVKVDCNDAEAIRTLQNEVVMFDDLVEACRKMLNRGHEADREIDESDREAIAEFLTTTEAREMGLSPANED